MTGSDERRERPFSSREAAKIADIPYRTMMGWTDLVPDLHWEQGSGPTGQVARWGFADLVTIRAVRDLRRMGISMQQIRKAAEFVHEEGADLSRVHPLGRDLVLFLGESGDALSALLSPGQGVIWWDRKAAVRDLHERAGRLQEQEERKRKSA